MQKLSLVLLTALSLPAQASERESEGVGTPRTDVSCESPAKDVSVRIMRFWPNYDQAHLVVLHRATLLEVSEVVTVREADMPGAPREYQGTRMDLSVQLTVPPTFQRGRPVYPSRLQTRPFGGDLALGCEGKN
jgi:hypothetical protein